MPHGRGAIRTKPVQRLWPNNDATRLQRTSDTCTKPNASDALTMASMAAFRSVEPPATPRPPPPAPSLPSSGIVRERTADLAGVPTTPPSTLPASSSPPPPPIPSPSPPLTPPARM
eukprot:253042-Chlamydomonas_euryale.AAC.2